MLDARYSRTSKRLSELICGLFGPNKIIEQGLHYPVGPIFHPIPSAGLMRMFFLGLIAPSIQTFFLFPRSIPPADMSLN